MKLTLENENGIYTAEEKEAITIGDALELIERLLIAAGFQIERDSLDIKERT